MRLPILLVIGGKGRIFVRLIAIFLKIIPLLQIIFGGCHSIIYNTIHINIIKQPIQQWSSNPCIISILYMPLQFFFFALCFTDFVLDLSFYLVFLKNTNGLFIFMKVFLQSIKLFIHNVESLSPFFSMYSLLQILLGFTVLFDRQWLVSYREVLVISVVLRITKQQYDYNSPYSVAQYD